MSTNVVIMLPFFELHIIHHTVSQFTNSCFLCFSVAHPLGFALTVVGSLSMARLIQSEFHPSATAPPLFMHSLHGSSRLRTAPSLVEFRPQYWNSAIWHRRNRALIEIKAIQL